MTQTDNAYELAARWRDAYSVMKQIAAQVTKDERIEELDRALREWVAGVR
jgi:hypothetical protein